MPRPVVDGQPFLLRGINWYGAEDIATLPEGLNLRRASDLVDFIADHGFNSLRLMFNMESWAANPTIRDDREVINAALNPELFLAKYRAMLLHIIRAGESCECDEPRMR
jgi:aryl-phospho-beta-D-glucosidase BglC (GH1 family)